MVFDGAAGPAVIKVTGICEQRAILKIINTRKVKMNNKIALGLRLKCSTLGWRLAEKAIVLIFECCANKSWRRRGRMERRGALETGEPLQNIYVVKI